MKRYEDLQPSPAFQGIMLGLLFGLITFAPAIISWLSG